MLFTFYIIFRRRWREQHDEDSCTLSYLEKKEAIAVSASLECGWEDMKAGKERAEGQWTTTNDDNLYEERKWEK